MAGRLFVYTTVTIVDEFEGTIPPMYRDAGTVVT